MKLTEIINRILNIEDEDKVKNVVVRALPDVNVLIDQKKDNKITCTNAILHGNCTVDRLTIYDQGEATIYGGGSSYHPQVHDLRIMSCGKVTIRGVADIGRIHMQASSILFCTKEFLEETKDAVLAFEKNATITIIESRNGGSYSIPYEFRGDVSEHDFINEILHPSISILPNPRQVMVTAKEEDK